MHGVQPKANASPTTYAPSSPSGRLADARPLLREQPADPEHTGGVQAEHDDHDPADHAERALVLLQQRPDVGRGGAERHEHGREAEDEGEAGQRHAPDQVARRATLAELGDVHAADEREVSRDDRKHAGRDERDETGQERRCDRHGGAHARILGKRWRHIHYIGAVAEQPHGGLASCVFYSRGRRRGPTTMRCTVLRPALLAPADARRPAAPVGLAVSAGARRRPAAAESRRPAGGCGEGLAGARPGPLDRALGSGRLAQPRKTSPARHSPPTRRRSSGCAATRPARSATQFSADAQVFTREGAPRSS